MDHKNKHGFTLIELIVVLSIITILSTLGVVSFLGYLKDANDTKRVTDIQAIKMSLDTYRKNHSYLYPQTAGGSGTLQIMSGSEIIAAQTWFDEDLAGKVGMPKVYLDPKTRNNYLYSISRDRTHYQITATLQNTQNLIAYLPGANTAYAGGGLGDGTAYVEGNFIPNDPHNLPGLLYAQDPKEILSFDIRQMDSDNHPNLAKVILNGQSYNLAYDGKGRMHAGGIDLDEILGSISLVKNNTPTQNYQSCIGELNPGLTFYHGENDVSYLGGTSLNSQIGWKYKTCDGTQGSLKPASGFYYNCANIGAGALFDNECRWTGCAQGYVAKSGAPGCKPNINAPQLATPQNGAYNLPINGVLSWYPVSGTSITYHVYLGKNSSPEKVSNAQTIKTFAFSNLEYSTTYYWYIEACDGVSCIPSITYTFSTLPHPDSGNTGGGDQGGSQTPPGQTPDVQNCESGSVICTANDITITYVGTNGTPLDGVDKNFGISQKIPDKYYGTEKILQYKIANNSDGRAQFEFQFGTTATGMIAYKSANASFDDSNPATVIDLGGEQIANNFFWKAGNGCLYNSLTGNYEIIGKTTCFLTLHARGDSSISANTQTIGYFKIVNKDSFSNWGGGVNYTTPSPLLMKTSGFTMNPLTLAMTGTGQEAMEPSSDMGPNDFGTSHRVGGAGGQAYGYYKSLIYTISNSNSEDAYFKVAWNGKNTGYTDSFGNNLNYDFPTMIFDEFIGDVSNLSLWTGSTVYDWGGDGIGNILWKNNTCTPSQPGSNIGKGFIVPKSGNCTVTLYFRGDTTLPFESQKIISLQLANQTIADKVYTYDTTLKARADGWGLLFTQYVQSEILGWIKLHVTTYGPRVIGMAESEMAGWICFDATCGAEISRSPTTGALSGYALSEMFGWIKLDGVFLKEDGTGVGYALSEIIGWINFNF